MSDGPFKSLSLPRQWKRVANSALNPASSTSDIARVAIAALSRCDRELPTARAIEILTVPRSDLFETANDVVERLCRETAHSPNNQVFLEALKIQIADDVPVHAAVATARSEALVEELDVRSRDIVQQAQLELPNHESRHLRQRLVDVRAKIVADFRSTAEALGPVVAAALDGLDNGPEL